MKTKQMKSGIVIFFLIIMSGPLALAEITGSKHDFSDKGWSGQRICKVCHTPHNANTAEDGAPLWNHAVTTQTFIPFSSPTIDPDDPPWQYTPGQPTGNSKLCLSCHDGITAIDSFGGNTGGETITTTANLGTNLLDDHPVSMDWNHQTIDWPNCTNSCHFIHGQITIDLPMFDRKIQCATCHDVHNGTGLPSMLRITMDNSELCVDCHQIRK